MAFGVEVDDWPARSSAYGEKLAAIVPSPLLSSVGSFICVRNSAETSRMFFEATRSAIKFEIKTRARRRKFPENFHRRGN